MYQKKYIVDTKMGKMMLSDESGSIDIPDCIDRRELCNGRTIHQNIDGSFVVKNEFHMKPIVGQLHLSKQVSYISSNGKFMKKFTPLVPAVGSILVKTAKSDLAPDLYAVVQIEGYENGHFVATVLEYIKDDVIPKAATTHHWSRKAERAFVLNIGSDAKDLYASQRIVATELTNIIAIDPEGCQDVDDALHVKKLDDGAYEVGIHIADVSSFISSTDMFDEEIAKRVTSIYCTDKVQHMIPAEISVGHMSLTSDVPKRTFSTILRINADGVVESVEFKRLLISVRRNISYEHAQQMLDEGNSTIGTLYDVSKSIYKGHFCKQPDNTFDVHKMIEVYMLLANNIVAETIARHDSSNVLLRSHEGYTNGIHDGIVCDDKKLYDLYTMCNTSRAHYHVGVNDMGHQGLGIKLYTHYTSPMRRYADVLVHRQLTATLCGTTVNRPNVDVIYRLNNASLMTNVAERYVQNTAIAKSVGNRQKQYDAVIINVTTDHGIFVRVYIEETDTVHDVLVYSSEYAETLRVDKTVSGYTLYEIPSEYVFAQYDLFQHIKVIATTTQSDINKLRMRLSNDA